MLSFLVYLKKNLYGAQSRTLFRRGTHHPYSWTPSTFCASNYQKTKSQAFETKYYGHPANGN